MMYYDYFLNIDVSVYQTLNKQKAQMEVLAVRLDVIKKIIALLHYDRDRFVAIAPSIDNIIDS